MATTTRSEQIYIHDSISEDDPERAVFGEDTCGIVDEEEGGVVAYTHRDNAEALCDAWRAHVTA